MSEIVDLGLKFRSLSTNITPQGVTAHYGGPSPWRGFRTDHNRCPAIVRSWHAYHLSKRLVRARLLGRGVPSRHDLQGPLERQAHLLNGTNPGNQRSYAVCYLAGDNDPVTEPAKRTFHDAAHALGQPLRWNHAEWKSTSCAGDPIRAWQRAGWPPRPAPTQPPNPQARTGLIWPPRRTPSGRPRRGRAVEPDHRVPRRVHRRQRRHRVSQGRRVD